MVLNVLEKTRIFTRNPLRPLFRTNSVYGQTVSNRRKSSLNLRGSLKMKGEESLIGTEDSAHTDFKNSPIINVPIISTSKVTRIAWISTVLALFSGLMTFFWPAILHSMLQAMFVIKESSMIYELWKEYPIPIYTEVYLFNCTNPEEVMIGGKPRFTEHGPYVYREIDIKEDLEFTDHYTVRYSMNRTWFFVPELSNGSLDDEITSIDLMAYTSAYMFRNSLSLKFVLSNVFSLYRYKMFSTHKVREVLFEGYSDPLLTMGYMMPIKFADIPFDKIGLFYSRNGSKTFEGRFEINTGVDDVNKIGQMVSWNNKTNYKFYDGECSEIKGSAGEFRAPGAHKDQKMFVFAADICRVVHLSYKDDRTSNGISLYRYSSNKMTFANSTTNPDYKCYEKEGDKLYPDGIVNIERCRFGAPLLVSLPHFTNGDPSLREAVEGMNPDPENHETFLDIEPTLSVPVKVTANLQMNIALQPIRGIRLFSKAPEVVFPVAWVRQRAELTPYYYKLVKLVVDLEYATRVGLIVLLSVSLEALVVCLVWRIYKQMKFKNAITDILYNEVE